MKRRASSSLGFTFLLLLDPPRQFPLPAQIQSNKVSVSPLCLPLPPPTFPNSVCPVGSEGGGGGGRGLLGRAWAVVGWLGWRTESEDSFLPSPFLGCLLDAASLLVGGGRQRTLLLLLFNLERLDESFPPPSHDPSPFPSLSPPFGLERWRHHLNLTFGRPLKPLHIY